MHHAVLWASREPYGSSHGREINVSPSSSAASPSSMKSLAPKPIGLRNGKNDRKSSSKTMKSYCRRDPYSLCAPGWYDNESPWICSRAAPQELAAQLADASAKRQSITLRGNGTKDGMAGPVESSDVTISTNRLNRVLEYEPRDLTVSVEAGHLLERIQ